MFDLLYFKFFQVASLFGLPFFAPPCFLYCLIETNSSVAGPSTPYTFSETEGNDALGQVINTTSAGLFIFPWSLVPFFGVCVIFDAQGGSKTSPNTV